MRAKLKDPPEFDAVPKEPRTAFVQELWRRIVKDPNSGNS